MAFQKHIVWLIFAAISLDLCVKSSPIWALEPADNNRNRPLQTMQLAQMQVPVRQTDNEEQNLDLGEGLNEEDLREPSQIPSRGTDLESEIPEDPGEETCNANICAFLTTPPACCPFEIEEG